MNKTIQLQDLGNKDYKETWEYQEELFKGIVDLKIRNRRGAYFSNPKLPLFVEHPHVYTLGKSGDLSNLLLSEKQLEERTPRSTKLIAVEISRTMDQVKL
jgi:lipoyl(octanoyl) transferase